MVSDSGDGVYINCCIITNILVYGIIRRKKMKEIEVGEYVRTKDGEIHKIKSIEDNFI